MTHDSAPATSDATAYLAAVGQRVRFLRLLDRRTQVEVADAADISRSFLSMIEHGVRGVDIALLLRLAHALGTTLTELLPDDDTGRYDDLDTRSLPALPPDALDNHTRQPACPCTGTDHPPSTAAAQTAGPA